MTFGKLRLTPWIAIIYVFYGVIVMEKMVTEDYRPWAGDRLTSLAITRGPAKARVRVMRESPELLDLLSRYAALQAPLTVAPSMKGLIDMKRIIEGV